MNTANTLPDKNAKNRAITALKKKKNHIDSHEENKRKPIFERELALLVALQGESSWKGWGWGWGDIHWKDASRWREDAVWETLQDRT